MSPSPDLGLVLLHGLPGQDPNPFFDLQDLQVELKNLVESQGTFAANWSGAASPALLALQAKEGKLGEEHVEQFDRMIRSFDMQSIQRLILGAYSGGGWILYQWLAGWRVDGQLRSPSSDILSKIVLVFTIASPWRNVERSLVIAGKFRHPVTKWDLESDDIASSLHGLPVHVFYSDQDATVPPSNAMFPPILVSQDLATNHLYAGLTHEELPHNHSLMAKVCELVSSIN